MQITSQKVGEGLKHQLQISVVLGLPVELKVVCRSASRNDTSYEIFDQHGASMGKRSFTYAMLNKTMNGPLVDDLNVLLDEFGITIEPSKFDEVSDQAIGTCEARYGYGRDDGDVVITLT
ncbi:MAG TPA: hypothetical protein VG984_01935 [Candidatus Paceibacterota bacterium]|nr:hypothetical protein [Candidatus Paceibacterota bacterium]